MQMPFARVLLIVVAATLPLGACMTAAEQQAQARAIAASDDAACRRAGAKPGTPAYVKCRENRKNQRAIAQTEAQHAMQRSMWTAQQMNTQQWMFRPRM